MSGDAMPDVTGEEFGEQVKAALRFAGEYRSDGDAIDALTYIGELEEANAYLRTQLSAAEQDARRWCWARENLTTFARLEAAIDAALPEVKP